MVDKKGSGKRPRRRPTQSDVARLAGVSPAVISAVFNKTTRTSVRVSAETVQRVQDAVRALGYVPDPVARSLVGHERRIIGVFTFESAFPSDQSSFFYPFLRGIERGAEEAGYDLLLFTSATAPLGSSKVFCGGSNRLGVADGAILLGREPDKAEIAHLAEMGFLFVVIGRLEVPDWPVSYVAAGSRAATRDLVGRLVALGHGRIAYIGLDRDREQEADRESGYRDGLTDAGLAFEPRLFLRVAAEAITPRTVASLEADGVTAILGETFEIAERITEALGKLGLDVPGDISLALLGAGVPEGAAQPRWTSFTIPREQMGRSAVELLLELMRRDTETGPIQRTLPCPFESCITIGPAR